MLTIIPASRADVAAFIARTHRHHKPPAGDVFRLAVVDETGAVRGVASVGRPVARMLDDGWTLEVNRVATDGAKNACSLLYGAARRVAWTMGYRRILTYTLPEEGGASLRAAGWTLDGATGGARAGCITPGIAATSSAPTSSHGGRASTAPRSGVSQRGRLPRRRRRSACSLPPPPRRNHPHRAPRHDGEDRIGRVEGPAGGGEGHGVESVMRKCCWHFFASRHGAPSDRWTHPGGPPCPSSSTCP